MKLRPIPNGIQCPKAGQDIRHAFVPGQRATGCALSSDRMIAGIIREVRATFAPPFEIVVIESAGHFVPCAAVTTISCIA